MNMLFRQEVVDQAANKLEGEVLLLPKFSHKLITTLVSIWVIAVVFLLVNGQYSRKETVAGWLAPDTGIVRVFSPSPESAINEIYVADGQYVEQGDELFLLSAQKNLSNGEEFSESLKSRLGVRKTSLLEKKERVHSEFLDRLDSSQNQIEIAVKEYEALEQQLETVKKRQVLSEEEVEKFRRLLEQELISSAQYNKVNKELLGIIENRQSVERGKSQQLARIEKFKVDLRMLPDQEKNRVDQIEEELTSIDQQLLQVASQYEVIIRAPISGKVTNLQVSLGQGVSKGIPLLNIVPRESKLLVNLLVPVRAAGFLEIGQNLDVRYSAFPYQKFGSYRAEIASIPDTVMLPNEIIDLSLEVKEAVYVIKAELESEEISAYGKTIQLKNGMSLTADVLLSKRSLIEWLLEPLYSLRGRLK